MERKISQDQMKVVSRLENIGIVQEKAMALVKGGLVFSVEGTVMVTRREMVGSGLSREEIRKVEDAFTPPDMRF